MTIARVSTGTTHYPLIHATVVHVASGHEVTVVSAGRRLKLHFHHLERATPNSAQWRADKKALGSRLLNRGVVVQILRAHDQHFDAYLFVDSLVVGAEH